MSSDLDICLPPLAPVLLEAMRAIGYSFESALADVIDNSLSAGATKIDVKFSPYGEPYIAIVDDGCGMTPEALIRAMRHGSNDPNAKRSVTDLGRFGLGLKTASLSQCRRLTVISKRDGIISGRGWDLDVIAQREDWILTGLTDSEIRRLPNIEQLFECQSGTMVLWQQLDRASAGESSVEAALGEHMDRARQHLALVFHRFLNPERPNKPVLLRLNNNPVEPLDPFLSSHRSTQVLPEEAFSVGGHTVSVLPFILPHISKLTTADAQVAGGEEGLRRNQGFYVYRNRRLIVWGSWFRLIRQEEMTKLARVRVDIPNTLDHLWTLDVRKSSAYPPDAVRARLRAIVARISESSRRVYTYRGRRNRDDGVVHSWDRRMTRTGVSYLINRDHPLVKAVETVVPEEHLGLLHKLMRTIETTLPYDSVYADMASERRPDFGDSSDKYEELYDLASSMLDAIGRGSELARRLLDNLWSIEPFSLYPDETKRVLRKLTDA
jgi:Histidine kinase-, DNA gyrase B-, and HSP90-like ATPase